MKIKLYELSDDRSDILVTRPLANTYRKRANELLGSSTDNTIEFDFSNIKAVDTSFLDEIIFRFLEDIDSRKFPRKYIFLSHMSENAEYDARMIFKAKKRPILIKLDKSPGWELLFKVESNLKEVLALVMKQKKLTTSQLKKLLNLQATNTASMRLIKLHNHGLIKRQEQISSSGREYVYSSLF